MKKFLLTCSLLLVAISFSIADTGFRILFYNVENLFDTVDDPLKDDDEFLPEGTMKWKPWRYWEKLRNITRVITAVGGMYSPALVGLCEVENDSVLFDLTRRSPLRAQGYEYVITSSPDERGVDVALLYQRHQFRLLEKNEHEVLFSDKRLRPTRNILHVAGKTVTGDTLDLFVCHWPSRRGGQRESEPARIDAASLLRRKVDSLFSIRGDANIVIMGDFNDNPDNRSISLTLGAGAPDQDCSEKRLYNLFSSHLKELRRGTYFFQGNWELPDQIIVSGSLLRQENPLYIREGRGYIFSPDFLLREEKSSGVKRPYRTYYGPRYIGGFSDHLPVYADLEFNSSGI